MSGVLVLSLASFDEKLSGFIYLAWLSLALFIFYSIPF